MIIQITGKKILIAIGIGAILYFAGKYSRPAKIVETKIVDEQLTKQKLVELEQEYNRKINNITTTTTIKNKDGSSETIIKVDKSQSSESKNIQTNITKTEDTKHTEETKTTINNMLPDYFLHVNYDVLQGVDSFNYKALGLGLDYRLFGTFYATSEFNLTPSIRLGVSLGF